MYEKDGEKYFVVDSHMHYWDASPENWVTGQENYAKGWIECFHAYQGARPAGDALDDRALPEVLGGRPDEGRLRGRPRRRGDLPADVPQGVVPRRASTRPSRTASLAERHPGQFIVNTRWDPREGDAGLKELEENVARWGSKGVKLYTAEWQRRVPWLDAEGPRGLPLPGEVPGARHQEHPRPQGPDDLAAGQGRLRRRRRRPRRDATSPTSTSSSSTSACRGSRTSASWRRRSPTSTPGCRWSSAALMHARPKFFAKVMGELLFWVGEDKMTFGSDYSIWEPKWQVEGFVDWDYPDETSSPTTRGSTSTPRRRSSA